MSITYNTVDLSIWHGTTICHIDCRFCVDCRCVWSPPPVNLPRESKVIWILGTHHKTGSFLIRDMWKSIQKSVNPVMKMHLNIYKPMLFVLMMDA